MGKLPIDVVDHLRVMSDELESFNNPELRRLLIACGNQKISKDIYPFFRGAILLRMRELLGHIINYTRHGRRKTIFLQDLVLTQDRVGIRPPPRTSDEVLNTLEKIKKFGDGYFFSRAGFTRATRAEVLKVEGEALQLSKQFLENFQYHIEFEMRCVAAIAARGLMVFHQKVGSRGQATGDEEEPDGKVHELYLPHFRYAYQVFYSRGLVADPAQQLIDGAKAAIKIRNARSRKTKASKAKAAKAEEEAEPAPSKAKAAPAKAKAAPKARKVVKKA